jgi:thioredoxin-like negative regulator of GroEL
MINSPDTQAVLLVSPGCAHCAATKRILDKFLQEGLLTLVDIVDVTIDPAVAQKYNVRSVPWLKLGPIHLSGAHSEPELRQWLEQLNEKNATQLFAHLLKINALDQVISIIEQEPNRLSDVLPLAADPGQDLKIRLGVSAVFEFFENRPELYPLVQPMGQLARSENARVRADAAHFLSLTHSPEAIVFLQQLAQDTDPEVREIANDGLQQ